MPITLNGTTGEVFPSWTTATRPASPSAGQTGFNTTTGQMETYDGTSWEIYAAASSQGTSGQVLTSAGAGAAPTWSTLSTTSQTTYTSGSGTWTKPSSGTYCLVRVWAGGGSGARNTANACGGGGGSYAERIYLLSSLGATESYSVGAGGAAKTANASGSTGGNSTFGSGATLVTAYGGGGGGTTAGTCGGAGNLLGAGGGVTPSELTQPWSGGDGNQSTAAGLRGWMGGGGGGGAYAATPAASAGGTSVGGGAGGAGSYTGPATAGTQPGGGGGAGSGQNSGKGGDGQIQIWVW